MPSNSLTVALASDLHLDFAPINDSFFTAAANVLILAGDTVEIHRAQANFEFFKQCSENFETVLVVCGNHEWYKGNFPADIDKFRLVLEPLKNVIILDSRTCSTYRHHSGIVFWGATLWTSIANSHPEAMHAVKRGMNDYRVIRQSDQNCILLSPERTISEYHRTVAELEIFLKENPASRTFVITHHAPSFNSVHPGYIDEVLINTGYASNLSDLILDNPQIEHWVHGHIHWTNTYKIGETTIHSYPRGYPGEDSNTYYPMYLPKLITLKL